MTAATGADALPSIPLALGRLESPCSSEVCSQCCHDVEMLLTDSDVRRISAALAVRQPAGSAPTDWHFRADDGFLQLRTRDGPPARGSPGGRPCVLLGDDGRCTVWDVRPEGCRLYPAIWDEGLREAVLDEDYCPHTDGFRLPRSLHDATRRLAARLHAERDARR